MPSAALRVRTRRHPASGAVRRERGASHSLQWALLAPVVVLALVGTIQAAIVLRAQQTARSAAMAAAEIESRHGASEGDGRHVAAQVASQGDLRDVQVSITRQNGLVTVTVSGSADTFLDIGQGRVTRTASMPLEEP